MQLQARVGKVWGGVLVMLLACAATTGAAGLPTRTTIVLDGGFDDWQTVLANPRNVILDGDGSSIPCAESTDRDCIVSKAGADVRRMALTWDDQNLYLYVERMETANNQTFLLYVDRNHDGRFGSDDWVLDHLFHASQGEIEPAKRRYEPLNASPDPNLDGDPTEDALGFGDGYSPPGTASGALADLGDPGVCSTCTSADGRIFEFAWPWASLGLSAQQAIIYHLASGGSANGGKEDNLGGPGDGRGSTRFLDHTLDAPLVLAGGIDETVLMPHRVTNRGNWPDVLSFEIASSQGMEVCIFDDPDDDGLPDALLGCDAQGNRIWSDPGDFVSAAADSDSDGIPDTGTLPPGASFSFVGEIVPSNKHNRRIELTRYRLLSTTEPGVAPAVRDETAIGNLTIIPRRDIKTTSGSRFHLPHAIANHLPTLDVFDLTWVSSLGWTYTPWSDPDRDGDPSDGVPLFDTDGDGDPDVNIPSGETFPIVMVGDVPAGTSVGIQDSLDLTVRSTGNVQGKVTDTVLVARAVELRPDHTFAAGLGKAGSASYPTFFRHYLTWNGDRPARFDLAGISSRGYAVDFFTDPNGDGNPADGVLLPEPARSPALAPFGGTWVFLARVSVPLGEPGGTIDTTDVFALQEGQPSVFDQVTDETRVTLIQAFQDVGRTLAISHSPVCSTVYARATGLVPSLAGQYRVVWTDPLGTDVQADPFTPDANGEGYSEMSFPPDALLGVWSIGVQEVSGSNWTDLDRTTLEIENEGVMDALFTDRQTYSVADTSVTVTSVLRNNGVADLGPVDIDYRILTPDRSQILESNGTFRSFNGNETTWDLKNLILASGETAQEIFSVVDLTWPGSGVYHLEATWENACDQNVATTVRSFFVAGDSDGDGLNDADESAYGLDWTDRDTDDDGILDGQDGIGDADGDTVVDALECDADGDTLPDSVEAGLDAGALDSDTDISAGCFVPDGDAGATVTDRLLADTDGGGLPDGEEDVDGDGVVDPGEKDPAERWDDACATIPPPEVRGLRLRKIGGDLVLGWQSLTASDPCVTYRVHEGDGLRQPLTDFTLADEGLGTPSWGRALPPGSRSYLVQASAPFGGDGPLGYTGP